MTTHAYFEWFIYFNIYVANIFHLDVLKVVVLRAVVRLLRRRCSCGAA